MGSPVLLSDPNGARYQAAPHPENRYRLATSALGCSRRAEPGFARREPRSRLTLSTERRGPTGESWVHPVLLSDPNGARYQAAPHPEASRLSSDPAGILSAMA